MELIDGLPVLDATLDDEKFTAGVNMWSFVNRPATEEALFKFTEQDQDGGLLGSQFNFKIDELNKDKNLVRSVGMVANKPIYRNMFGKEFFMRFTPDVIERMAFKFMKDQHTKNVNQEHDAADRKNDVYVVESFIVDKERNGTLPEYLSHATEGSWVLSFMVEDEQLMKDIDEGKVNGISLEGDFGLKLNFTKNFVGIDKKTILAEDISVFDKFNHIKTITNASK